MTDTKNLIKNLHPLETKVLLKYGLNDELTSEKLQKELGYKEGHANQAFSWLGGKALIAEKSRTPHTYFELTDFGRKVLAEGFAEEKIVAFIKEKGAVTLPEIAASLGIENKDVGSAFGALSKDGVLAMNAEKKAEYKGKELPARFGVAKALIKKASETENAQLDAANLSKDELDVMSGLTKKRGISETPFKTIERETVVYQLTEAYKEVAEALKSAGITGNEIGEITPAMLSSGDWKEGTFRGYNITIPPARIIPGRTNPYVQFLESVKD
ncbi:MAG: phenylalanine--tRNA ligase subunit alpha, partial [Treponema sp.]|nr:phenylalanine--tRNA ligase subunit alpha [Treponema sp.]